MTDSPYITAICLAVVASGVWWLIPSPAQRPRWVGLVLLLVGGVGATVTFPEPSGSSVPIVLLWLFGGGSLLCGALMITSRNPVHGALWFALATLAVCGLFVLLKAPFLAAATIVVYAGAIIVTFLFVIMLAQQSGSATYDSRSHHPFLATAMSFLLFGALLTALHHEPLPEPSRGPVPVNSLSREEDDKKLGEMHGLGKTLFGDYLFAVELAGTLLLIASIGAIAVAPRREQGHL